jgi:hypothetical protein
MFGIKMQHYSCDFTPVSTLRVRVEEAQIRDDVLFVVCPQLSSGARTSGHFPFAFRATSIAFQSSLLQVFGMQTLIR